MTLDELIAFYTSHIPVFQTNAVALGLLPADLTALAADLTKATTSRNAALAARQASKGATTTFHDSTSTLASHGQIIIDRIRIQAEATNNPGLYGLAQIPPPAAPLPLGPPGQPENIVATINEDGFIALAWKSKNSTASTGAFFSISRQFDGVGAFTLAGAVPNREFVDTTIPVGTGEIAYRIQGRRGQQFSEPSYYTVRFGAVSGPGLMIASQGAGAGDSTPSGKLAA